MRVILFTEGCFGCGATYKEAFKNLEEAENGPPGCRNDEEEFLEDPVPIGMVLTDDDTATVDSYGAVVTKYGSWTLNIPLKKDSKPSFNHRFNDMQKWHEKEVSMEIWDHRMNKHREEFHKFCNEQGWCESNRCEFKGKVTSDDEGCFQMWYEKYKKPELDKEKKDA